MTATTNPAAVALAAPGWHSDDLDKIAPALAKIQGELGNVAKAHTGRIEKDGRLLYTFKYADLAAIIDASRPLLAANGVSVIQRPMQSSDGVRLHTILLHESGQWIGDGAPNLPVGKKDDPKAYGSAYSYQRRYSQGAMLGIAQEDDDAVAAAERPKPAAAKKSTSKLAPIEARDALHGRIMALPDELRGQIAAKLKEANVIWAQLSPAQLKTATAWTEECEGIAAVEAGE